MSLKQTLFAAATTLLCTSAVNAAGYLTASAPANHRPQPLQAQIWYPSAEDGAEIQLGRNAVFLGDKVRAGATPKQGPFPVVVLSHGSGGNAANLSWIASHIADQGMIVVATNHPGSTSGDSDPFQTVKLWERPADVSALIDMAETGLPNGISADLTRIAAIGFSLGGYTALAVAGAEVSKADYIDYCNEMGGLHDCRWFKSAGVDLTSIDQTRYERSNLDPRITAAVAIDPALGQAYKATSLRKMDLPVQIINLGAPELVPAAVDGSPAKAELPSAVLINIEQANHFSFLGLCTKKGWLIIKATGEDPICSELGKRDRAEIHEELKSTIARYLAENL